MSFTAHNQLFTHRPRCTVAGVAIDCVTMDEAATEVMNRLMQRRDRATPFLIMGPNAQLINLAQHNPDFVEALQASALNVPDGISTVFAARLFGRKISERVPGGELMERLCRDASERGLSVYLLGGLPGAADGAAKELQRRYPSLSVAGIDCPPLGFEHDAAECARIRQRIVAAAPDLLFVAFGAPKQEIWMYQNCLSLPICAAMSVGAAFDTLAGLRKRAPLWTQKANVEWLYRLVQEPRRLWRRYLIGNVSFLYLVLEQFLIFGRQVPEQGNFADDTSNHYLPLSSLPSAGDIREASSEI